jgi:hypothetical protein
VSLTASPIPANLPSVHRSGNDRIPRPSRRRSPEAPARARQSPQDEGRKALLSAGIPAYSRPSRNNQDRPVTPEVAGSSPVAPVKIPAKWHIALSGRTRKSGRLHKRAFGWGRNGRKPTETLPGVAKTSRSWSRRGRPRSRRATTRNGRRSRLSQRRRRIQLKSSQPRPVPKAVIEEFRHPNSELLGAAGVQEVDAGVKAG